MKMVEVQKKVELMRTTCTSRIYNSVWSRSKSIFEKMSKYSLRAQTRSIRQNIFHKKSNQFLRPEVRLLAGDCIRSASLLPSPGASSSNASIGGAWLFLRLLLLLAFLIFSVIRCVSCFVSLIMEAESI